MFLYVFWFVAIIAALTLYFRQKYYRFTKYGVKHSKPLPLIGNMGRIILKKDHFGEDLLRRYNSAPDERFVGKYEFLNPVIIAKDLDLVKKITVKDFEHFLDHRAFIDENNDPLFGRNLFSLKGQEWKDMRSTLSPAFTSSKMRLMLPFMVEVGDQMIQSLKDKIKDSGVGYIDFDAKDLTTRYANDVIASCAFGLKVDSHTEENNDFYTNGKEAATFKYWQILKSFAFIAFPKLMTSLKLTLFTEKMGSFFKNIVLNTMQNREERNIIRPDMIHLLMEAKKGKLTYDEKTAKDADAGFATVEESSVGKKAVDRVWSENDLVAQAFIFFIAGFETVSSAMSLVLHELALNPHVQEKLAQEIKENDIKNNGKFDYKTIQNMTYMDMVVSEVLRLWPPAVVLDRICVKEYNLGKPNSKATEDYIIRKGEGLVIPAFAFHRDPNFFPDPLKFDPERFSEENKHKIQPFSYMPFGIGPRNCIGSRFALCEVKVMLYQLLQHMEVTPNERTCIPTKLDTETFNVRIKGGHWLRMKIRS
ncbi:cytochrome P450 9e2-like isoform 1-T3 [Aphomia sociella]